MKRNGGPWRAKVARSERVNFRYVGELRLWIQAPARRRTYPMPSLSVMENSPHPDALQGVVRREDDGPVPGGRDRRLQRVQELVPILLLRGHEPPRGIEEQEPDVRLPVEDERAAGAGLRSHADRRAREIGGQVEELVQSLEAQVSGEILAHAPVVVARKEVGAGAAFQGSGPGHDPDLRHDDHRVLGCRWAGRPNG